MLPVIKTLRQIKVTLGISSSRRTRQSIIIDLATTTSCIESHRVIPLAAALYYSTTIIKLSIPVHRGRRLRNAGVHNLAWGGGGFIVKNVEFVHSSTTANKNLGSSRQHNRMLS